MRNCFLKSLLLFLLLSIAKVSHSQEWHYLGDDVNGNKLYIYDKLQSSPYAFEKDQVWTKTVLKNYKRKVNGRTVNSLNVEVKILYEFSCLGRTLLTKQILYYTSTGKLIKSEDNFSIIPSGVVPESMGSLILETACQYNKQ